jgi:aryl-alcohol dehydrogenase-like predicted oxidoreductase
MMTDVPRIELRPGYSIARIINGCWQLTPDHGGGPKAESDVLKRFAELVEHGFTTFDCADIYEGTEAMLGRFRKTLKDPTSIQVHTKFVPDKATLAELDAATIDAVIDRSRQRLGVDMLDLVQFHWWDYSVPGLEHLYERLLNAQGQGRIRYIGVTNFSTPMLVKLLDQDPSVVSMQVQYSLLDRRPERQMARACSDADVGMFAFGALAGGFLSERYLGKPPPESPNRSLTKYRLIIDDAGGWDAFQSLLRVLAEVGSKHGASIDQVAARWVLDRPGVSAVILGIGSRSRAAENQRIGNLALDKSDRAAIDACLDSMPIPEGEPYDLERDPEGVHSGIIRTNLQDAK